MSNFAISPTLNKNKVFILNRSELVDRWDPLLVLYKRENQSFKYETKRLKNLLVSNPEYGAGEIGIQRKTETEPRYIRITDIDEFGLLSSDTGVTAKTIDRKYFLEDNDFLFARSGATVGKAYLHKKDLVPYPCFYAGYMIRYRLNEKEILPEYLFAITQTRFYKNWVKAIQRPTGQPNINAEEYKSLTFPLPPFEIQKKVVKIFSLAYEQKKQNETAAEKLLASIDDYLLKELGITLPIPPENILKNRIFKRMLKEVSGNRFDPRYYQNYFIEFYQNLNKKYPTEKLKDIAEYIGSGSTPTAGGEAYTDEANGVPFIRITNLKNDTIDLTDVLFIKREIHETSLKRTQLKAGELLLSMAGTIGLTVVVPSFIKEANINQALARIVLKNGYDNIFVKEILNSKIGKTQTDRLARPAVQANINFDEIGSLLIPVPPLAKQKEIAEHITDIRKQAQQLKDKTKEELKKASEEIGKILLTQ